METKSSTIVLRKDLDNVIYEINMMIKVSEIVNSPTLKLLNQILNLLEGL